MLAPDITCNIDPEYIERLENHHSMHVVSSTMTFFFLSCMRTVSAYIVYQRSVMLNAAWP
jgi:hypothetical protein